MLVFRGCKLPGFQPMNKKNTPHVLPIRAGWTFHNDADLITHYASNPGSCSVHRWHRISPIPWNINMEPDNDGLEDDFPFQLGGF